MELNIGGAIVFLIASYIGMAISICIFGKNNQRIITEAYQIEDDEIGKYELQFN